MMDYKYIKNNFLVKKLIEISLDEDMLHGDCTSDSLIKKNRNVEAVFLAKSKGIIAGLEFIPLIIKIASQKKYIKNKMEFIPSIPEKSFIKKGCNIGFLRGDIKDILKLERTFLNFLGRISGVATYTKSIVDLLKKGSRTKIYDTRKTIPGWRFLDKYAVFCGSGANHRIDLGEYLLIKDNHWDNDSGSVISYLSNLKNKNRKKVEVEIDNFDMLYNPVIFNSDIIMLDNFSYKDLIRAVKYIRDFQRKNKKKIEIEVSGGVSKKDIRKLSNLDIDRISIGAITHSAQNFDISLEVKILR
jgi:nicotinate-nucleotide pyrophosphorylase (carboxylating)